MIWIVLGGGFLALLAAQAWWTSYRRKQRVDAAGAYFATVSSAGAFPLVGSAGLQLRRGEFAVFTSSATFHEMRAHRTSTGASVRVARGVWVNKRKYNSTEGLERVDSGDLVVTNRRIAFVGGARGSSTDYKDLLAIEAGAMLVVQSAKRQKSAYFKVADPTRAALLAQFFAANPLDTPALPAASRMEVERVGDGAVRLRLTGVA